MKHLFISLFFLPSLALAQEAPAALNQLKALSKADSPPPAVKGQDSAQAFEAARAQTHSAYKDMLDGRYKEAIEKLGPLVQVGNPSAQALMGFLYHSGRGVEKDEAKGMELFQKSAAQGYPSGMFYVGRIAFEKKDYPKALENLKPAADLGNVYARITLARMYREGLGVDKDADAAAAWMKKAAAGAKNAKEIMAVADSYHGAKEQALALELYKKAALQGEKMGSFLAGFLYSGGNDGKAEGVAVDHEAAYAYFRLAYLQGETFLAPQHAGKEREHLTDEQAERAMKTAKELKEQADKNAAP